MGMNKALLVFIVASGFLLFIYANSSVFNRHLVQKDVPERLAAAAALVHRNQHPHHHQHHEGKHRNGTAASVHLPPDKPTTPNQSSP